MIVREHILGCRVDAIGRAEALERIAMLAAGERPGLVVTLGVEMIVAAQNDTLFLALLDGAALVLCDTVGVLLASRLQRGALRERVTGVDLIEPLAERSQRDPHLRLYFIGSKPGIAQRAADDVRTRYPLARIVGARDGYFRPAEQSAIVAAIRASGATIVLAGLGSPRQEFWLAEHLAASGARVGIGVGGSFDVLAGAVRRAPALVQRFGFEWLYRLINEPSRWRRQLALPRFAFAVVRNAIVRRSSR